MKKITFLFFTLCFFVNAAISQIGINTIEPDTFAVLEIYSGTKGLLIPRLDSAVRVGLSDTLTPKGLLAYDKNMNKFFVWDSNEGNWQIVNPWKISDAYKIMSITKDLAEDVIIGGNLIFNGNLTSSGSIGYTGIINPDNAGSRILVKNGIIVDVENGKTGKLLIDAHSDYDTVFTGSVAFMNPESDTWTIQKDSYGNPNAFVVSPGSGGSGFEGLTFSHVSGQYGYTIFKLLDDNLTEIDRDTVLAISPSGNLTIQENPIIGVSSPGQVTFSPGTGADSWTIEIDPNYGNPLAMLVSPYQGTTSAAVLFTCELIETVSTRFILKSGNKILRTLIVTHQGI